MTPQRLRNKLRKIRERGEEMAEEGGELNLIPYLDIVTNVIMFMLATTTFAAALGDINVSAPSYSRDTELAAAAPTPPKNDLNLTVSISERGFTLITAGALLYQGFSFDTRGMLTQPPTGTLPTIPRVGKDYDYATLTRKMQEIKSSPDGADETKVIVNADPTIPYEVVVNVMDACRNNGAKLLFPDVLLSAGVN